jgi:hypothetical protein
MGTEAYSDSRGLEFLAVVERLVQDLPGDVRNEVMSVIAGRYAKLELLDHAIELTETISDPFTRDNTFTQIAAASITTGNSDYADALLDMLDDPAVRSMAIETIAIKYAELGNVDKSLELVNELDDADQTLRGIALVDGILSPGAIELALSITAPDLRADTLGQLATAAYRAERTPDAAELLAESLRAAEEIEFSQSRIYALIVNYVRASRANLRGDYLLLFRGAKPWRRSWRVLRVWASLNRLILPPNKSRIRFRLLMPRRSRRLLITERDSSSRP